ncbi:MAG: glycosyltransferase [Luteitalea sp.]|nr:glycosyltransferase [Luteitalea sp.]
MKVCVVYKEDYPWDVRVEKIVDTLAAHGYDVTLVARNTERRPTNEKVGAVTVRRLPALPEIFGRLNNAASFPFFFNPLWLYEIFAALWQTRAPVVIVRDLPLMPAAILIARVLGRRVVFDMAECYPMMYASTLRFSERRLGRYLLKNPTLAALIERLSVRYADHVLVMVEESRDRLLRMGVAAANVTIVSNTPRLRLPAARRLHAQGDVLRLVYVGFITRIRGIDNALRGLAEYAASGGDRPAVELHVVGKGAALPECRALAEQLGIAPLVQFHGWCHQEFVNDLYAQSDIGVLTYRVCDHWNHTIPNKLFDYMYLGIPVLSTNVRPIRRIVDEVGCGLICTDDDARSFADCLGRLADPQVRQTMGGCGFDAVRSRYNWGADSARLLKVIQTLRPAA